MALNENPEAAGTISVNKDIIIKAAIRDCGENAYNMYR